MEVISMLLVQGTVPEWRYLLWYWGLHLAALAIVLGVLWILHRLLKRGGGVGIWSVVIGKDRRVSTSKLQVALWSVFVPAALLSILLHAFPDLTRLADISVPSDYLFLLGLPAATAIAAKGITTLKVAAGTVAKVDAPSDPNLERGAVEAVGDDQGNVEIFDLQYFLFNLVALVFFLGSFVWQQGPGPLGFPEMPTGLLYLTGASAAGYLGRKTLEREKPSLVGIYPEAEAPGEEVWLKGVNLTIKVEPARGQEPQAKTVEIKGITFGGIPAGVGERVRDDEYKVRVPVEADPGPAPVRVTRGGVLDARVARTY